MARTSKTQKVILSVLVGIVAIIGVLIAIAWATRTPLYTLQPDDEPECVTPASDREVLIGLAVSGGGSRAALFAAGAFDALSMAWMGPRLRALSDAAAY